MRAVIQRVKRASVIVNEPGRSEKVAEIGRGLVTLLGVRDGDQKEDAEWLIRKIVNLRIFADANDKMNLSLQDTGGAHLIVSQFTLWADCSKGLRPSFIAAARPEVAEPLYQHALSISRSLGVPTQSGRFQASMEIELVNDGPVTLILDSPQKT